MKKEVIFLLMIVVFITSCTSGTRKDVPVDWNTGTQGLVTSIRANFPPSRIIADEGTEVTFIIDVQNKGIYETNANLFLTGYDKNIMDFPFAVTTDPIEAKSEFSSEGGKLVVDEFTTQGINLDENVFRYNPAFLLTNAFDYETNANIQVCIDPDPFNANIKQKACNSGVYSGTGSQGAPIAISSVELKEGRDKVYATLDISNVGNGLVVPYSYSGDMLSIPINNQDLIEDYEVSISNYPGSCKPDKIRFENNHAQVFCTFETLPCQYDACMTNIKANLKYIYITSTTKTVEFVRTP